MTSRRVPPGAPQETAVEPLAATNGNGKHLPRPMPPPLPPEEKPSVEPGFFWDVFRKWARLAVFSGLLLAGGISALVWRLHVPAYRSSFLVKITDRTQGILSTIQQTESFVLNQRVLLRSNVLLNQVLQNPEVASQPDLANEVDPVAALQQRIEVRQEAGSNMFKVTCEASSPESAATILNALISQYFQYYQDEAKEESKTLKGILEDEASYQRGQVGHIQDKVNELVKKGVPEGSDIIDPLRSAQIGVSPKTHALFSQLVARQVERTSADVQLKAELENSQKPVELVQALIDAEIDGNLYVRKLKYDIQLAQEVLKEFKADSAPYRQQQAAIERLQTELKQYRERLAKDLPEAMRQQTASERAQKVEALRNRLKILDSEIASLRSQVEDDLRVVESKLGSRLELALAQVDLERAKARLSKVDDEIWRVTVEQAPDRPAPVRKVQTQADVPKVAVETVPYKKMAAFSLVGLVLPFGLCVAREFFARRLFKSEQLTQEAQLPLLGEVATLPNRPRIPRPGATRRYQHERLAYEESVDSLRVTLALCDELAGAQVLVVASAVSGEGKSTLAARLAFSCARGAGEKVLLIDGDLRAPDLHKFFEIEAAPGLGEALLGEKRPEEVIVDWGHGLHVLPAGGLTMSPHRLFSNGAFHELMAALRQDYDRIVIDVPPVLSAGESLHIAKEADGVLFCARKDVSRVPQVKMACNRLELSGARILGCVFLGVSSNHYST